MNFLRIGLLTLLLGGMAFSFYQASDFNAAPAMTSVTTASDTPEVYDLDFDTEWIEFGRWQITTTNGQVLVTGTEEIEKLLYYHNINHSLTINFPVYYQAVEPVEVSILVALSATVHYGGTDRELFWYQETVIEPEPVAGLQIFDASVEVFFESVGYHSIDVISDISVTVPNDTTIFQDMYVFGEMPVISPSNNQAFIAQPTEPTLYDLEEDLYFFDWRPIYPLPCDQPTFFEYDETLGDTACELFEEGTLEAYRSYLLEYPEDKRYRFPLGYIPTHIGLVALLLGDSELAEIGLYTALEEFEALSSLDAIGMGLHNIGVYYMWRGDIDSAFQYLEAALRLREASGDIRGELLTRTMIAVLDEDYRELVRIRAEMEDLEMVQAEFLPYEDDTFASEE